MAQRIKGQECQVVVTNGGQVVESMDAILNFNFSMKSEVKSQGYIGEKSDRKDDIYNGTAADLELHISKQDIFRFIRAVKDRQTRVTPNVVFNITMVMQFPNGDTPAFTIPDIKFGEMPLNIASRADYVKIKVQGEAENFEVIES